MIPSTLGDLLPEGLKLRAFDALEVLAEWRQPLETLPAASAAGTALPSLWVFASTIGELNAIEPLIRVLLKALGDPPLSLLSDRTLYAQAYQQKFPGASVHTLAGRRGEVARLSLQRPPKMLLVAEIPALLHDAPCRFSYAAVRAARAAKAPVVLVNGWLYGYAPPSRLDRVESFLFARDYVRAFDLMLVQTDAVRAALVAAGADPQRVATTGNIKFDAMLPAATPQGLSALGSALARRATMSPVVVAGSVTETAEQHAVLQAFQCVQKQWPEALLVLAPRHPENKERMAALIAMLDEASLAYGKRSEHEASAAVRGPVMLLDTMGELRACYAAATIAFVGTDHNVLEPLSYGKPVFVLPGWEPTYPSYPVYSQLRDAGVITALDAPGQLGQAWLAELANPRPANSPELARVMRHNRDATQRSLAALRTSPALAHLWPAVAEELQPRGPAAGLPAQRPTSTSGAGP